MRSSRTAPESNGRPKFQPLPDVPPEKSEALKADIAERGVFFAAGKEKQWDP